MHRPIAPEHITALNAGRAETRHLADALAVDFTILMKHIAPQAPPFKAEGGFVGRMAQAGQFLKTQVGFRMADFKTLSTHPSDTVRGWACYGGLLFDAPLHERVLYIQPFADDLHFGVREWAWIALRPFLMKDLDQSMDLLRPWTVSPSERLRRFACEALRPRGVWCAHIPALKKEPWRARALLDPLSNDSARYVQLSVGNWLNDASKDHPEWVQGVCAEWAEKHQNPHTDRICKRALRTIKRQALKQGICS